MAGMVRKRGNSYQALLSYVDPETHKTVQFSKTCPTRPKADAALAEMVIKRDQRKLIRHNETVAQLAARWLGHCQASGEYAATTLDDYEAAVRPDGRLLAALGHHKCRDLTTYHIDAYIASLAHLAPNTRNGQLRILSAICSLGVRWNWMDVNPVKYARKLTPPKTKTVLPDADGLSRLLEAAELDGPYSVTLVRLAMSTGCRHGEMAGLRWGDIDFDTHSIRVQRQVTKSRVVPTKGSKPGAPKERTNCVGVDCMTQLKLWREDRELTWRELYGRTLTADDYVFAARPTSSPCSVYTKISKRWEVIREYASLPGMRLHDLRHFVATKLLTAKMAPQVVAERLGHADPTITLRTYAHVMAGDDNEAADIMDDILRG